MLAPLGVPAMRKDFLVDPYQVLEARAAGAGGVLIILRMLAARRARGAADGRGRGWACSCCWRPSMSATSTLARELLARRRGVRHDVLVGVNCRDL